MRFFFGYSNQMNHKHDLSHKPSANRNRTSQVSIPLSACWRKAFESTGGSKRAWHPCPLDLNFLDFIQFFCLSHSSQPPPFPDQRKFSRFHVFFSGKSCVISPLQPRGSEPPRTENSGSGPENRSSNTYHEIICWLFLNTTTQIKLYLQNSGAKKGRN